MAKNKNHSSKAPTQRQLRVGELVRRALSDIFLRDELYDPELSKFSIVVTEVRCSPDLRNATAFISALGGGEKEAGLLKILEKHSYAIRKLMSQDVNLKFSPKISFKLAN